MQREGLNVLNSFLKALSNDVPVVEPARLMTLLEDCVKWQQHQGLLPLDTEFDIFKSAEKVQEAEEDAFAQYPSVEIKVRNRQRCKQGEDNHNTLTISYRERTHMQSAQLFHRTGYILCQVQWMDSLKYGTMQMENLERISSIKRRKI